MIDLLGVAIAATVKGAVSHYVRKSLEKIDQGLLLLVESGDQDRIREYITAKSLEPQITELASETLRNSYIIPTMPGQIATFDDRAELFQHVLQFGFNLSNKLQADIFLPGSLHSPDTFTLFRRNKESAPQLSRERVRVSIPHGRNYTNEVFTCPQKLKDAKAIFEIYKETMVWHIQNNPNLYFTFGIGIEIEGWDNCRLEEITAGSCRFEYATLMTGEIKDYFQPNGKIVPIKDWPGGLREMFLSVEQIPDLQYLTPEQTKEIKDAYELFQRFN